MAIKEDLKKNSLLKYYNFSLNEQKKYPVVTGVLKEMTPEGIKKEIGEVTNFELPVELKKWVEEYEKVADRDEFLWKWLYKMFKIVHLPCVPKDKEHALLNIKLLFTMFVTLLDDVADQTRNKKLLERLLEIPFKKNSKVKGLSVKDQNFYDFSLKLWNSILRLMKKDLPKYSRYREIFEFDLFQALNEMRYACLLNDHPYIINKKEYWAFLPYNMCLYVYSDMDVMTAENFEVKKFGVLREIVWNIQITARIGNWLSTWKRELKEEDLSNIIFAYYLEKIDYDSSRITKKANYSKITNDIQKQKIKRSADRMGKGL